MCNRNHGVGACYDPEEAGTGKMRLNSLKGFIIGVKI